MSGDTILKKLIGRTPFLKDALDHHMLEVISGASTAFVLKAVGTGLAFLFNVVLARKLGVEGAGLYFLAFTVISIAGVLSCAGLDNALLRFVASSAAAGDWTAVKGACRKGLIISAAASVASAVLVFSASPWIAKEVFSKPELAGVLRWMSLAIFPMSMLVIYSEMLKGLKLIMKSHLVQGVLVWLFSLTGILFLSGIWGVYGAVWAFIAASFATAVIAIILWRRAAPQLKGIKGNFRLNKLLDSSVPLFLVSAMYLVIQWTSTFALGIWGTKAEVGVFSVAFRTAMLISFVLIAVNSIAAPKFAALYSLGDMDALGKTARNSARLLTLMAAPVLALFIIFPSRIMGVFGEDFRQGGMILAILAAGQFVNVSTGSVGYLLMMSGNERILRNNVAFAAAVNVALNALLVPRYGILGAAAATALSVSLLNITASYLVYKKINIKTIPWPDLKRWSDG